MAGNLDSLLGDIQGIVDDEELPVAKKPAKIFFVMMALGYRPNYENLSLDSPGSAERIVAMFKMLSSRNLELVPWVLNGEPTAPGEHEESVAVGAGPGRWIGSGLLISPNIVLTAGHLDRGGACRAVSRNHEVNYSDKGIEVQNHKNLANCLHGDPRCLKDISILLTKEKISLPHDFPTLAAPSEIEQAGLGLVVGYGHTDTAGTKGAGRRRKGGVLIEGDRAGRVDYDPKKEIVTGTTLEEPPQDACSKDSGGPLFVWSGEDQAWRAAGIISRGIGRPPYYCGRGTVHTLLGPYLEEIDKAIEELGGERRQIKRPDE